VQPVRLGGLEADPATGHERLQPGDAQPVESVGVGELMQQERADAGAEQVAEAAVQAREDQVQRPEQLVRQRGPRQDPAAPQPGPDQLLDPERRCAAVASARRR